MGWKLCLTLAVADLLLCFNIRYAIAEASPPAFTGAQGYGAVSTGGRGGRLIEVNTLTDSGPGSLREALQSSGPRTIVFRIGGVITLSSTILVTNPNVTVAGQTAPGEGITLRFAPQSRGPLMVVKTNDVILRYLKFRRGNTGVPGDNLSVLDPSSNIIVDHCDFEWATDENLEIYSDTGAIIHNVTIQNSIIAEALAEPRPPTYPAGHPLGFLISAQPQFWSQRPVSRVDIHHSLFAHNTHRNPRILADQAKIVGNVMYNWYTRAVETISNTQIDWIANFFKLGPMSNPTLYFHDATDATGLEIYPDASIFIEKNMAPQITAFAIPSADNWSMVKDHYRSGTLSLNMRRLTPLPQPANPIEYTLPSLEQLNSVLNNAGVNERLNCSGLWESARDSVDARIIQNVQSGTGPTSTTLFTNSDSAGGYSTASTLSSCVDSDKDGMPDAWETQFGLNPLSNADSNLDLDGDGYTNLEEFLNGPTGSVYRIFVTSKRYNGNLGGIAGADAKCQALAVAAGIKGVFRAVLSDSTSNARDRMKFMDSIPIRNMSLGLVAKSQTDLFDGKLSAAVNRDEKNEALSSNWTWTGSDSSGFRKSNHCNNWSSSQSSIKGHVGAASKTDRIWLDSEAQSCSGERRLYCAEQF